MIQQYSLNVQAELHEGWLLEVGYVGTRGTHLVRQRSLNQALPASANNPIRGVTENTVANIPLRSSRSRSTSRLPCADGIRGQLLVQRAGSEPDEAVKPRPSIPRFLHFLQDLGHGWRQTSTQHHQEMH